MKLIDYLLLAGVAALLGGAFYVLHTKGSGCCGKGGCEGCSGCGGSCNGSCGRGKRCKCRK